MPLLLILAVGQDQTILSTRCAVLRSAGYIVREASSIMESIELFQDSDFDLVLLCHSIPSEDRDRLTRVIRSSGSRIPIFTVAPASANLLTGLSDRLLSSRPAELIKELESALRTQQFTTPLAGAGNRGF